MGSFAVYNACGVGKITTVVQRSRSKSCLPLVSTTGCVRGRAVEPISWNEAKRQDFFK
jgi:hypothetical protein